MNNNPIRHTFSVLLDGAPFSFSGRARLRGRDTLSLYPALFSLDFWNLPEEWRLRLSRARAASVSFDGACLASGRVRDVFHHGDPDGIRTTVSLSLGLELWEAVVSLSVPAETAMSETVRRILAASGAGIPLLSLPGPDPVFPRAQAFFGRAAECAASVLSAAPARPMLTPAGLKAVSPFDPPAAVRVTERDLLDVPAFTGGSLRGAPTLMVLQAAVSGWRPGQVLDVRCGDVRARGLVTERSVSADTDSGDWKCELVSEVIS